LAKLIRGATDGSPNFMGESSGLLKRIQDTIHEMHPSQEILLFHCCSLGGALQNCFKYVPCDKRSCDTCEFHLSKGYETRTVTETKYSPQERFLLGYTSLRNFDSVLGHKR
jgi:hypothetical protein